MKTKVQEDPDRKVTTSLAVEPILKKRIDARAKSLNQNRSEYLCNLAIRDIEIGGPLILHPFGVEPKTF